MSVSQIRFALSSMRSGISMQHHRPSAEFDEWLPGALGGYRDEIVHFGALLLNDLVIREWSGDHARAKHALYLDEAR